MLFKIYSDGIEIAELHTTAEEAMRRAETTYEPGRVLEVFGTRGITRNCTTRQFRRWYYDHDIGRWMERRGKAVRKPRKSKRRIH